MLQQSKKSSTSKLTDFTFYLAARNGQNQSRLETFYGGDRLILYMWVLQFIYKKNMLQLVYCLKYRSEDKTIY